MRAEEVRNAVKHCKRNCWMIGSAAPAIWQHPVKPIAWVLKNKIKSIMGRDIELCLSRERAGTYAFHDLQSDLETHHKA